MLNRILIFKEEQDIEETKIREEGACREIRGFACPFKFEVLNKGFF